MAQLTPEQFEQKLAAKIKELQATKLIFAPATAVRDMLVQRLFSRGIGGDNKDLGVYDSTPAYFSKKAFKKTGAFKAQGKPSFKGKTQSEGRRKAQLARGNSYQRTSMYLPYGYKQLKAIQGMQSSFVDLQYSKQLRSQFATQLVIINNAVVLKLQYPIDQKKVEGLTAKYGPSTFKHTKEEREFFKTEVTKNLIKFLTS